MTEAIVIREGREDDVDAIVAGYEWLFAPPGSRPPMWDAEAARARVRVLVDEGFHRGDVFVAMEHEVLVGLCTVVLDIVSVRFGQRAWVEDLAVDPGRRSLGVGKALLDAARVWGRAHGATHLELDSGEARPEAHRFYEREQPSWRSKCYGWML